MEYKEYTEEEDSQNIWEMMVNTLKIENDVAYSLMSAIIDMYVDAEVITIKDKTLTKRAILFGSASVIIQNQFGLFYGEIVIHKMLINVSRLSSIHRIRENELIRAEREIRLFNAKQLLLLKKTQDEEDDQTDDYEDFIRGFSV
jgi:hypothetical protein